MSLLLQAFASGVVHNVSAFWYQHKALLSFLVLELHWATITKKTWLTKCGCHCTFARCWNASSNFLD